MPEPQKAPDPSLFWDAVTAFHRSAAIRAAVELDVFTAIAAGANTIPVLAEMASASERGLRILCDTLTVWGFLTKSGETYALTPDSAMFLDRRSKAYVGGVIGFLQHEFHRRNMDELTETIRAGKRAHSEELLEVENEVWVEFARSMVGMVQPMTGFVASVATEGLEGPLRVLDIAAGHGLYGVAVAKARPDAHITALDWPKVLEVAKENAARAGVMDRYELRPGSALDADLGEGYDVVLVTNFYHHFDKTDCVKLAKRFHAALKPGGRMVTLGVRAQRRPGLAAGRRDVRLDHAGEHAGRRRVYLRRVRCDVSRGGLRGEPRG
ncbi:MAG: class I SAM-dependent methyltransferase [Bryobacterales bacterium]